MSATFTPSRSILSFFDRKSEFGRRAQMVRIARKLSNKIELACRNFHEECASMEFDAGYHLYLGYLLHRQMSRYDRIVDALAAETGLPAWSVRNELSASTEAPRLLTGL